MGFLNLPDRPDESGRLERARTLRVKMSDPRFTVSAQA